VSRFLLDTHLLLWSTFRPERLSRETRALLQDSSNELSFSTASIWEITIKRGLKRPDFQFDPHVLRRALLDGGYDELNISSMHAMQVGSLPHLHGDPFDRLLVAQAQFEGWILLTSDSKVAQYGGSIRVVR